MTGDEYVQEAVGILNATPLDEPASRHAQRQLDALVQLVRASVAYAQESRCEIAELRDDVGHLLNALDATKASLDRVEDHTQHLRGPRRSLREFVGIAPTGVAK